MVGWKEVGEHVKGGECIEGRERIEGGECMAVVGAGTHFVPMTIGAAVGNTLPLLSGFNSKALSVSCAGAEQCWWWAWEVMNW